MRAIPGSTSEFGCYRPEEELLRTHHVDTTDLLRRLEVDTRLSPRKRQRLIDEIQRLPSPIRIALVPNQLSCDFAVMKGNDTFVIEFHEQQHRTLKDNRLKVVYFKDEQAIELPRFVQRFLRDIWRIQAFPNFSIVWYDWFEAHGCEINAKDLLSPGFHEFSIPGRFSFTKLLDL